MKTNKKKTDRNHPDGSQYALRREGGCWLLTFRGWQSMFRHELGALYVACLLREPPGEPVHGVALALHSREKLGQPAGPADLVQQRGMGLEDAASVRALWRRPAGPEREAGGRSGGNQP